MMTYKRLIACLVFLSLLASSPNFVLAASRAGLTPDSPFYFIDIVAEKFSLFFTFRTESKIKKILSYADERLAEAIELARKNKISVSEGIIASYESDLSTASEKVRTIESESKKEELLNIISSRTLEHQERLVEVYNSVPDEAKIAIEKAIAVGHREYEKALAEIKELKSEVMALQEEIEKLRQAQESAEQKELEKLKQEIENLKKKQAIPPSVTKPPTTSPSKLQTSPTPLIPAQPQVSITAIVPSAISNSSGNLVNLSGSGFKPGATVSINNSVMQIIGAVTDKLITIKVPAGFFDGIHDVAIINPDGSKAVRKEGITILKPPNIQVGSLAFTEIVANLRPSTVLIRTTFDCGSGFVFDSEGYVLTNAHVLTREDSLGRVIERAYSGRIIFANGREASFSVVGREENKDVAVLKIDGSNFSPAPLGNSDTESLPQASEVIALGYPITCNEDVTYVSEQGIVTTRRVVSSFPLLGELIQTSARIHSGNSGGPLVNRSGEVVGVNTISVGGEVYNTTGISYAIPINTAKQLLAQLKSGYQVLSGPSQIGTQPSPSPPSPSPSQSPTPIPSNPGTLTIDKESSPTMPNSQYLVAGDTSQTLAAWRFSADNTEDIRVTRIKVFEIHTHDKPGNIKNLKIFVDGVQTGATVPAMIDGVINEALFEDASNGLFTIPKNSVKTVLFKADMTDSTNATFLSNGAGLQMRLSVPDGQALVSSDVSAKGLATGAFITITNQCTSDICDGNVMKVTKTKPTFALVSPASTTLIPGVMEVLRFRITAHSAEDIILTNGVHNIRFTQSSSGMATASGFELFDAAPNMTICSASGTFSNGNTIDFSTCSITIPKGSTKEFFIRTNLTNFTTTGSSIQLSIQNAASDLSWSDNTVNSDISSSDFSGIGLPLYGAVYVKP